ncbi:MULTISPECIES: flavin reductase family protein [Paenarthrobacter]|uniref:Flavin reductase family protein n=1 Tax=Paenarthrobacter ureafaciens TaxID=37931 RepID=A0AAX3EJH3_PAEUR|nr:MULTISPECIES: flavin reductase family protein [Paenarthrobacter]MDO5862914.1 flavin reductase family protein [Paenarthrobacter sp. SD-2]MDO5873982.1 flavin reductase family protein [Paenarthrobacter sp. SD-1]UYV93420.1 flavin reductase family protein [Paenarthrobacter ureafaciens]UYV97949.1 flavin reductase family protein [Paenarthrobacter ureafaciens]WIV32458.1 flavin reductase family protein [Paenarthrobacter sp. R1]
MEEREPERIRFTDAASYRTVRSGRTDIDPREMRDSMGHYASGITIITGYDDSGPIGFTCQSFYSVSLEPPLVSFSVMTTSGSYPRLRATGRFCVNVLAHNQSDLSNQFARRASDKWAGVGWGPSAAGNPVLDDTLLWVDCETVAEYEAGDHYIVVGAVNEISPLGWHSGDPLVFFKGNYRHLRSHERPVRAWFVDEEGY